MKYEQKRKYEFVKYKLQPLLQEIEYNIIKAEYAITEYNEEYVIITYENNFKRKICVTADSIKAIVIDVIRQV